MMIVGMPLGMPFGNSPPTKDLSINPNIYFRGIYFNQDFDNIQDGVEFIDEMLGDLSYHKDSTKVFLQHKAIYFETGITSYADDEFRRLKGDHNNPHKTLYLYHFFDLDEIEDNHFKLHALLSNIENLQRLIVSAVYILAPNIPFKKNDDKDSMYVTSSDIYNVFDNLKVDDKSIVGEKRLINDICATSDIEGLKNELETFINTYYAEFQLIKDIINVDAELIKTKKIKCLEFEYVKCSNCEHLICEECLEESKSFLDSSIWYCSGCNELYCQDCVTECENCGDAFFCEECKDNKIQSCESCDSEFCLTCAEEIKDCDCCLTTEICPRCSDDSKNCNHCDEKLNKDD